MPDELLWRKKAQFGTGSGAREVLGDAVSTTITDEQFEAERGAIEPAAATKEELAYFRIFREALPGLRAEDTSAASRPPECCGPVDDREPDALPTPLSGARQPARAASRARYRRPRAARAKTTSCESSSSADCAEQRALVEDQTDCRDGRRGVVRRPDSRATAMREEERRGAAAAP